MEQSPINQEVLSSSIFTQYNKVKDMFCCTDQQLISYICSVDQHQGRLTVKAPAEKAHRQKELLLQSLQLKETDLVRLWQEAQDISSSTQTAVQQIRFEEQTQLRRVQELQDQLQCDVTELKRNISELDTLSLTPDRNLFAVLYPLLSTDSLKIQTDPFGNFEDVTTAVSLLRDKLKLTLEESLSPDLKTLKDDLVNVSVAPSPVHVLLSPAEPTTREDFLQYSKEITLDPNSANKRLALSYGNKRVRVVREAQNYPDHPDRFTYWFQILSKESLTGRCYWEVEWRNKWISIAVSYRDIERKEDGLASRFGNNDESWALRCENDEYVLMHSSVRREVSGPVSSTIGVYLDHSAGTLSFYSVLDNSMTLLHRVQNTFAQPLHAGVWIENSAHFPLLK